MFKDLMGNVFPADWMTMNLLQIGVFLRAINQYSEVLNMYFLDQTHSELQVGTHFLLGVLITLMHVIEHSWWESGGGAVRESG